MELAFIGIYPMCQILVDRSGPVFSYDVKVIGVIMVK